MARIKGAKRCFDPGRLANENSIPVFGPAIPASLLDALQQECRPGT